MILVLAGLLFTTGVLKVPFDANVYATSITGWAILLIAASIMPFLVFTAFGTYQKTIVELLQEVQQQRDQIAELAARDQLTGLPMAGLANDRLQMKMHSALRDGSRVAFMFIDLNDFKAVNDTWGHEAGDHLLQEIASRLRKSVRSEDTVARVGGDEFIVMLGNLKNREEAIPVVEKLLSNICQPVRYADQSIPSGASVGISIFPEDSTDIATLRRLADRAMYQIKRSGKNGFAFADSAAPLSEMPPSG
jgi:diguanylate cyclase (GGDEF)-like protein